MMKIMSFFVFVTAFITTWFLFHAPEQLNIQVHAELQNKLTQFISQTIAEKVPSARNFKMNKIFTEKMSETQVKAHFSYEFQAPASEPSVTTESQATASPSQVVQTPQITNESFTTQVIDGYAILSRETSDNPTTQYWKIDSVKSEYQTINFNEETIIKNDETELTPETSPVNSPSPTSATTQSLPSTSASVETSN